MDRYLKKLPAGWVKTATGYIIRHDNGASCEVLAPTPVDKGWTVINTADNGAKWCHWFPSFKQFHAALTKE